VKPKIDICSDLGEGYGRYTMANDDKLLELVTSANIACGFHAGDPRTMNKTVESAVKHDVGIGAHPSFPDRVGFGRRNMDLSYDEIYTDVLYQLGAIHAFTKGRGVTLQHVLPHGQLANIANKNLTYASAIAEAIFNFDPTLIVMAPPGCLQDTSQARRLLTAFVIFADRAYNDDGSNVSRSDPGAVITEPDQIVKRTLKMIIDNKITTISGKEIDIFGHTLLVHSDTELSLNILIKLKTNLLKNGVKILPLSKWLK